MVALPPQVDGLPVGAVPGVAGDAGFRRRRGGCGTGLGLDPEREHQGLRGGDGRVVDRGGREPALSCIVHDGLVQQGVALDDVVAGRCPGGVEVDLDGDLLGHGEIPGQEGVVGVFSGMEDPGIGHLVEIPNCGVLPVAGAFRPGVLGRGEVRASGFDRFLDPEADDPRRLVGGEQDVVEEDVPLLGHQFHVILEIDLLFVLDPGLDRHVVGQGPDLVVGVGQVVEGLQGDGLDFRDGGRIDRLRARGRFRRRAGPAWPGQEQPAKGGCPEFQHGASSRGRVSKPGGDGPDPTRGARGSATCGPRARLRGAAPIRRLEGGVPAHGGHPPCAARAWNPWCRRSDSNRHSLSENRF